LDDGFIFKEWSCLVGWHGFIFKEWSCLIGCTYSLKIHYHRTIAEGGNFFMVVELIIKKRVTKKGGKNRKKQGEREANDFVS
jgi:hypothetical protein